MGVAKKAKHEAKTAKSKTKKMPTRLSIRARSQECREALTMPAC
jgi:hypothetical protein